MFGSLCVEVIRVISNLLLVLIVQFEVLIDTMRTITVPFKLVLDTTTLNPINK